MSYLLNQIPLGEKEQLSIVSLNVHHKKGGQADAGFRLTLFLQNPDQFLK